MGGVDRTTAVALTVGTAFALIQLVDVTGTVGVVAYDLAAAVGIAAGVVGLRRNRPPRPGPWYLLLAGLTLFVVADWVWNALMLLDREPGWVSPLDVPYLAAYPLLTAGALGLAHQRGMHVRREAVLDALAFVLPAAAVAWTTLVEPSLSADMAPAELGVTIAYPLLDVVVLAAAVWLGFGGRPAPAQRMLLGGLAATFIGDVAYAALPAGGADVPVDDVAWALGYVLLGCALLHPSMLRVAEPLDDAFGSRLSHRRFVLLGASPAALAVLHGTRHWDQVDEVVLGVAAVFLTGLVVVRLAGLLRDVDAARRAVAGTERRFRALVQDSGELVVVLGTDARITYASPAIEVALGHHLDDVLGAAATDFVHPGDVERLTAVLTDLAARPSHTVRFEYRCRTAAGGWRWLDATATNLLADPDVVGIVINERDVTDERAADRALRLRAAQQEAVATIGQLALDGTPTEQLLDSAVASVCAVMRVTSCELLRVTADGRPVREASATLGDGAGRAPASSASVVVDSREGAYGSLIVRSAEPRAFNADDIAFLQSVANALALVLERRSIEAQVRWRATHDALTGLPNRSMLLDRLDEALRREEPGEVAVLFFDVDHFKVVNDGLGHDAGDRLLVAVAERLRRTAAPADVVARFGGDEFVVLRDDAEGSDVVELANALLAAIGEPLSFGSDQLQLDASIGVAVVRRGEARAAAVLRDADAAMYRAKELGRGRVERFGEALRARVVHRLHTEAALRRAVEDDELRVHYQPVVDLPTARTVGVEALLRWHRPDGTLLSPASFIPLAEETGLVDDLGRWVLRESCRQLAIWDQTGVRLELAVNVAPRQLLGGDLATVVLSACADAGIEPARLTLEITERALLLDADAAVRAVAELADLGVRLSIDDFGTGWSSLAYLKRLPVTELKVDRSFVADVTEGGADTAIVEATLRLAQTLGLRTVAEGIERPAQAAALAALGCDRGQGYLFCPPLPAEELVIERLAMPGFARGLRGA